MGYFINNEHTIFGKQTIKVCGPFGNKLPINFKRLIGLKITLVKFTYPKG